MISEGPCDIEDLSNDAENSILSSCVHPPIFMRILEYRIKNSGWKQQDAHKF